ncbi:hypothetical protein HU200_052373 [Digitaria exilis]|uniref:Cytochrome P450 n=1 Tax=Digitaria exilis TaxID=1010633 RepID=A0A835E7D6_9POAL|nr:hypothetical protein HU200_052373 [Digitaria exilis]CAB3486775.1 unnamed protein product [Digitaria exilis]
MAKEALVFLDEQLAGYLLAAKDFPLLITILPLLLLFLLLRYFFFITRAVSARGKKRLPPSPPGLPLIGHVHLIGALPHVSLRRLAERHAGEDGLMMLRLGVVPTLVATSARAAQAVLRVHDQCFASRPRSVSGDVLTYGPSDVALAPYGERWRLAKKLATTHLLSAKKVQSYRAAREEEVALVISKIRGAAAMGTVVDMSEVLSKFTSDMVCRAVAGRSFRVEGRDKVFRELIDEAMALLAGFSLENFYPGLAKAAGGVLVRSARSKAERVRNRWDSMVDKLIDEHVSKNAGATAVLHEDGGSGDQECDFIHVLLSVQEEYGLTREGIKAIVVNMFAAGTDTAYLVLEFALAELMLHREAMTRLVHEVRSSIPEGQNGIYEDNLVGMPYLKAVVKENLRLHPPSPLLLPHLSLEDCDIESFHVPAGTTVLVNVWAIGRDPKEWDAAEEFMPERFIHSGEVKGVDFSGKDFQILPFGSGRRMCPGMNFAVASIELMLANLVYHFDWELPQGVDKIDMAEVFGLTVSRKEKLLLVPMTRGIVCTF